MKNGVLIVIGIATLIVAGGATYLVRGLAPSPIAVESGRAYTLAHDTMMAAMAGGGVAWTGNPDADFAMLMIPHHQGAIDMAVLELRYGTNEQLRRIAQEIVVEQMQEIAAMKLAIGSRVTASLPAPTQPAPAAGHDRNMNMSPNGEK